MSIPVDSSPWFYIGHRTNTSGVTYKIEYDLPVISIDSSQLCPYLANGQIRKLSTVITGLDHLEGQLVSIVQDGVVSDDTLQEVMSGAITLNTPAAVVHVGLPYVGKLQFLPLGGDGQTTNDTKDRKVYSVVLRLWNSAGGKFGADENNMFPIEMPTTDILYTGDVHDVPFESSWSNYVMPVFMQEDPLPFTILAAVIRSEIQEDK